MLKAVEKTDKDTKKCESFSEKNALFYIPHVWMYGHLMDWEIGLAR